MTSTSWITRPDGKKVAITTSDGGGDFISLSELHFLLDPDEAPYHPTPRDIRPPGQLEVPEAFDENGSALADQRCERCLTIDLVNPPPLSSEGEWGEMAEARRQAVEESCSEGRSQIEGHVRDIGQFPEDFKLSTCHLCRVLASVRTRLVDSPLGLPAWPYEMHVVSAVYSHFAADHSSELLKLRQLLDVRRLNDTIVFAVDPKPPHIFFYGRVGFWLTEHSGTSGHLYPVASGEHRTERAFFGRQVQTDRIDYSILRAWMSSCRTYHPEACVSDKSMSSTEIPGFRLIDCFTRKVMPASTRMSYAALSYTWGAGSISEQMEADSSIPIDGVALVIEDAMTVARELGLQYLWVDQYCVPQDNPQVKMEQIRNMHIVYAGAELTIIAAAGEGASFGLPGVSSRRRVPQPSTQVKDRLFVSSGPHLKDLLKLSKWASRGWTYQEGLLSKRRLIFTEYQAYFECESAHCCEAIEAPPDVLFEDVPVPGAHSASFGALRVFPYGRDGLEAEQLLERIREYASKELTYKSDALNGVLGILAVFEDSMPSVSHIWGLPILSQTESTPSVLPDSPNSSDSQPRWKTRNLNEALLFALRWRAKSTERNPGFPSWSWVGWAGPLSISFATDYAIPDYAPRTDFWVEMLDGSLIEWSEFHASENRRKGKTSPASRFLHVEGPVVKLQFEWGKIAGKDEVDPHRPDEYGLHILLQFNDLQLAICLLHATGFDRNDQTSRDRLLQGTWDGLILCHRGSPLPFETDVLGEEVEVSYDAMRTEGREEVELLVLDPVAEEGKKGAGNSYHERLGAVKLVFPDPHELPWTGSLTIERKRFRIG